MDLRAWFRVRAAIPPPKPLDAFEPESRFPDLNWTTVDWSHHLRSRRTFIAAAIGVATLGAVTVLWLRSTASGAEASVGYLDIESVPQALVFIDNRASGTTPISLSLRTGTHRLVVRQGERSQESSVTVAPNASTVYHFTWSPESTPPLATGSLQVVMDGRSGTVTVDGLKRGVTPLILSHLHPGDHEVVVVRDGTTYRRTIRVDAGTTASLVVGNNTTGTESGWLSGSAAVPLQILEDGKLVGSTESERIMLPAGEHALEFANAALGFSMSRKLNIRAGRTQTVAIELPEAQISINATPWAQVWLDGRALGETPIGNLTTTIGPHELVLRHPQLGERRVSALVTMKEPTRIGVDMRRSQ
jgi:hypothetical protein